MTRPLSPPTILAVALARCIHVSPASFHALNRGSFFTRPAKIMSPMIPGTPSPQYSPWSLSLPAPSQVRIPDPHVKSVSASQVHVQSPQKLHPSLYFSVTQQFWQQEHAGLGAVGRGVTVGAGVGFGVVTAQHRPDSHHTLLVVSCALEYDM